MPTVPPPLTNRQPRAWPVIAIVLGVFALLAVAGIGAVVWYFRPPPPRVAESTEAVQQETRNAFAATRPSANAAPDTAAVTATLARFNSALKSHDVTTGRAVLDLDRLYDELLRVPGVQRPPLTQQSDFKKGLGIGVVKIFSAGGTMPAWNSADVRLVKSLGGGDDVVMTAKMRFDGYVLPMRFWFHKSGPGWRVYDWEDLSLGLRATTMMGRLMAAAPGTKTLERTQAFVAGIGQIRADDYAAAEKTFAGIDRTGLPTDILAAVEAAQGSALLQLDRAADALPHLKAAQNANADAPMVMTLLAAACNRTDDFAGAEKAGRRAIELLGPDGIANYHLGHALHQLNRTAEAITVFEQGLSADPQSDDCILGLAESLPPARQAEVGGYFARGNFPQATYRLLCENIRGKEAPVALASIADAYIKANGHTLDGDFFAACALFQQDRPAEAAALFEKYLSTADPYFQKAVKASYENAKQAAAAAATRPATRPAA